MANVTVVGQKGGKAGKVTAAGNVYHRTPDTGHTGNVSVMGQEGGEADEVKAYGNLYTGPDNGQANVSKGVPYKMDANPRGLCYIFNNKNFDDGVPSRLGTDIDRDKLKRVFQKLNFTVVVEPLKDKKSVVMEEEIKKLSKMDHAKYDCVVVFILSHGKEGAVKGSDNMSLRINKITSFFKPDVCPSLRNKPKLFFFQSCRGKSIQTASDVASDGSEGAAGGVEEEKPVTPDGDFYIGYSTLFGTRSNRNVEHGSWYIQELVDVFEEFAETEDLLTMMTKVKGRVRKHRAQQEDGSYRIQSAESVDSLAKPLYFKSVTCGEILDL